MAVLFSTRIIATLNANPPAHKKIKTWLGWKIVFTNSVSLENIQVRKPFIEEVLNEYLESQVDVEANKLVVPFTSVMEATTNPKLYNFKIKVYAKSKFKNVLFNYPKEPVRSIDGYVLEPVSPGQSHVNTVSIKPPPE
ncbi:MAG: hypothetical protein ABIQ31_08525 [Ferruginibacter sp.]